MERTNDAARTRKDQLLWFHNLVLARIYHEDHLLATRTYNYLTVNVFLAGLLVVAQSASQSEFPGLISCFGGLLSLPQAVLGLANERSIEFWRFMARKTEQQLGSPFDSAMYDYFKWEPVNFPELGVLTPLKQGESVLPLGPGRPGWWKLKSTNRFIGVVVPLTVGVFWIICFGYLVDYRASILVGCALAFILAAASRAGNLPDLPTEGSEHWKTFVARLDDSEGG